MTEARQNLCGAVGLLMLLSSALFASGAGADMPAMLAPLFNPPAEVALDFGKYNTLLRFNDGREVRTALDWAERKKEIRAYWEGEIGEWPPVIEKPKVEYLGRTNRETFVQHRVLVETAPGQTTAGYLLIPSGRGPFPGIVVPYYEPESSIGVGKVKLRDFALQLTRRGFVTLSIGSPGGDARKPELAGVKCQPLHFLGYIAANCYNVLANVPKVDPKRIGIAGHSYGGKWAMFGACFYEKYAAGVWSDPGIVFDEARSNVNYWEPWYLGLDPGQTRAPGVVTEANGRTGPYKRIYESGHDLHEVLALMAPRPFLVSGGAEDQAERWRALNRVNEVYELLGAPKHVAMSFRPNHDPTSESNEQIYRFFEYFLGAPRQ